jgi:hypothetical protein
MSSFNEYLQSLAGEVQNYDATEAYEPLTLEESYDATEVENYLKTAKRVQPGVAKAMSTKIVRNPLARTQIKEEMRKAGFSAGFTPNTMIGRGPVSAIFDLKIKRVTANIEETLPVPIFGPFDLASKYASVIGPLPSGVSLVGVDSGKIAGGEKIVTLTYRDNASTPNQDTVVISINQYEYPSFLEALKTSRFIVSRARYEVAETSATGLQMLSTQFQSINRSMFGKKVENDIPLSGAKNPYQQQNGIVDIEGTFDIDAQTTWVLAFLPQENTVTINQLSEKSRT